jgi:ketosteroid isomerase-like protein
MIGRTQLSEVEENLPSETAPHVETTFARLLDEAEIRRVVDEIDSAVDAKDWAACRYFFTDEVDVDFTSLAGGEPARLKADDLIAAWRTNLFDEKKSFHLRGNHRIEIDGNRAEVFSKGYAFNLLETGEAAGLWEVWGEYTHVLEKTEAGWRVCAMILKVTHKRGDDRVREYQPA